MTEPSGKRPLPWESEAPRVNKRRFYRRIEFYLPVIVVLGLVSAVVLYNQAMRLLGVKLDPEVTRSAPLTAAFRAPGAPEVLLYVSPDTVRYMTSVGGNHDVLVKPWRDFLNEAQRPFREIGDPAEVAKAGGAVLVVPSAVALGEGEIKAFSEHQKNGGGILSTGPFGVRDDKGVWRGWTVTQSLYGIEATDEVGPESEERYLATVGNAPVTHLLEAGSRVWLGRTAEPPLRFRGGKAAAWLTDWARTPNGKAPSIVYGQRERARWVHVGFSENSWDFRPTPVKAIMAGALDWLQRRPTVQVDTWPNGHAAAQVLAVNIDAPDHVESAASLFDLLKFRGSFFAAAEPTLAASLASVAKRHETGLNADWAALAAEPSPAERLARWRKAVGDARGVAGIDGKSTAAEEALAASAGFLHVISNGDRVEHRLPFFGVPESGSGLVVLPRTQRDDRALIYGSAVTTDETATMLKGELALTRAQGGLGVLRVNTSALPRDGVLTQAMSIFLLHLAEQKDRVWVAGADEVAQWWRRRAHVSAAINQVGARYELAVTHRGAEAIEGLSLILFHPETEPPKVSATKAWMPVVNVVPIDAFRSRLEFAPIKPGNLAYQVVFGG